MRTRNLALVVVLCTIASGMIFEGSGEAETYLTTVPRRTEQTAQQLRQRGMIVLEEESEFVRAVVSLEQLRWLARMGYRPRRTDILTTPGNTKFVSTGLPNIGLSSVFPTSDRDGDGLTDGDEGWWFTNPDETDTDGDGVLDGDEVDRLLDGDNTYGPPFVKWSQDVLDSDGDNDCIPDLLELNVLGLNPNRESTDGDKYDDGQEFFGITKVGWGSMPALGEPASMPSSVHDPGRSPYVTALPEIQIGVDEANLGVTIRTNITVHKNWSEKDEVGYAFAETHGTSTSVAQTEGYSVNTWQEASNRTEESNTRRDYQDQVTQHSTESSKEYREGMTHTTEKGTEWGVSAGVEANWVVGTPVATVGAEVSGHYGGHSVKRDVAEQAVTAEQRQEINISDREGTEWIYEMAHETGSASGQGLETSFAATITRTSYHEITTTQSHVMGTGKEWGEAYATDTSHAADLNVRMTFTNSGTDTASDIENLRINLKIGDILHGTFPPAELPGISLPDLSPKQSDTYSWFIPLTFEELRAIDLGDRVSVWVENFDYADESVHVGAWETGVLFEIDDGISDGDMVVERYLLPIMGDETYQDLLHRYFKTREHANGNIIGVETPEYNPAHSRIEYYQDHPVSDNSWWDIQLSKIDAFIVSANAEPYALSDGATLEVSMNGSASQTVRFFATDFDNIGAATAQEVVSVLKRDLGQGRVMAVTAAGKEYVRICSPVTASVGDPTVQVLGGSANLTLGFETGLHDVYSASRFVFEKARTGARVFLQFNQDTDGDNCPDRTEMRIGTDPQDPLSRPVAKLVAAYRVDQEGDEHVVKIALQNLGNCDASGVQAVMYSPDGRATLVNNLIGGAGRVKAGDHVIVGSAISEPDLTFWHGRATPSCLGYYTESAEKTFIFTAKGSGTVGETAGLFVDWSDGKGGTGRLSIGEDYNSPVPLFVADGLEVAFFSGQINENDSFLVTCRPAADTIRYTTTDNIEVPPIIISYNDTDGNHRLITAVEVNDITQDLVSFYGEMQEAPSLRSTAAGAVLRYDEDNNLSVTVDNPTVTIKDAHIHIEYATLEGHVVHEEEVVTELPAGSSHFLRNWKPSGDISISDMQKGYKAVTILTDSQGAIIDTDVDRWQIEEEFPEAGPRIEVLQDPQNPWERPEPETLVRGDVSTKPLGVANVGLSDLTVLIVASDPAISIDSPTSLQRIQPGEVLWFEATLHTAALSAGSYAGDILLLSNDPTVPVTVVAVTADIDYREPCVRLYDIEGRPWDKRVEIIGDYEAFSPIPVNLLQASEGYTPIPGTTGQFLGETRLLDATGTFALSDGAARLTGRLENANLFFDRDISEGASYVLNTFFRGFFEEWEAHFGGPENARGFRAEPTQDGGYIAVGETRSYGGDFDVLLAKFSKDGEKEPDVPVGEEDKDEIGQGVIETTDGGYIVLAHSNKEPHVIWLIKTDAGGIEQRRESFGGDYAFGGVRQASDGGYVIAADPGLIKTTADLTEEWRRPCGGRLFSVELTTDGGYIVTGFIVIVGGQDDDVLLVKIDANGGVEWQKAYGGDKYEAGVQARETSDGGYIIVGYTTSYGAGHTDMYLIKTDSQGNELWSRTYGGPDDESGAGVHEALDGGYVLVGTKMDSFGAGKRDVWLIATDAEGNQLSESTTFGGPDDDCPNRSQQTRDGGLIIAGTTFRMDGSTIAYVIRANAFGYLGYWGHSGMELKVRKTFYSQARLEIPVALSDGYAWALTGPGLTWERGDPDPKANNTFEFSEPLNDYLLTQEPDADGMVMVALTFIPKGSAFAVTGLVLEEDAAIQSITYNIAEGARLTWHSIAGATYTLYFTDDLLNAWNALSTFDGTGGLMEWLDDGTETGTPPTAGSILKRFYRLRGQP